LDAAEPHAAADLVVVGQAECRYAPGGALGEEIERDGVARSAGIEPDGEVALGERCVAHPGAKLARLDRVSLPDAKKAEQGTGFPLGKRRGRDPADVQDPGWALRRRRWGGARRRSERAVRGRAAAPDQLGRRGRIEVETLEAGDVGTDVDVSRAQRIARLL